MPPPAPTEPFSLRNMLRWSVTVARAAPGRVVLSAGLALSATLLSQFAVQVLADVISSLRATAPDHHTLLLLVAVYAALSLAGAAIAPLSRIAAAWADAELLRRLRIRLHDRLFGLEAAYHDSHPLAETSMVVMQFAAGAQPVMRNLVEFPVVRSIGFVTALLFLLHNLAAAGNAPPLLQVALGLVVAALAVASWRLNRGTGGAFKDALAAQTALAREFNNSAAQPLEVRLLGAEATRTRAFAAATARLAAARLRATIRLEATRAL